MELYNIAVERALLGSCMIDPDALADVSAVVMPDDFSQESHMMIYGAMLDVAQAGEGVDPLTVLASLNGTGDTVGGMAYLSTLLNYVPSSVHALTYARTVARLAWLRRFVEMSAKAVRKAYEDPDPLELYGWATDALSGLTPTSASDGHLLRGETITPYYDALLAARANGEGPRLSWPWPSWNARGRVRPPRPGDVSLFIAADGSGKTTYLNMMAEHWAKQGVKVVLYHLENGHSDLLDRRACRWAGIGIDDLESGGLTDWQRAELAKTNAAIDAAWGANLHYAHCPGWTMRQVLADVEHLRRNGDCEAVIIDYFDKLTPDADLVKTFRDDLRRESAMMERLKSYAEQTGVYVLTASQMTKSGKAAGRQATRNDMRGTGEKSDKCQLVLVLHRPISEEGMKAPGGQVICRPGAYSPHATVTIDKQNRGETGPLPTQYFDGARHRVLDPTQERP